jgi:putative cell wall-binding protein
VLKPGGMIYILGGPAAISNNIFNELAGSYAVLRLGGANRYETAAIIAGELAHSPETVFIATGENFPDALSVSSAAARLGAPVLLTRGGQLDGNARQYLSTHRDTIKKVYVIGGQSVISEEVYAAARGTRRIGGTDRWATSVSIAREFFRTATTVALASGRDFPDALTGSVLAAAEGAPVLLVDTGSLPPVAEAYFNQVRNTLLKVYVFGGPRAVAQAVFNRAAALMR